MSADNGIYVASFPAKSGTEYRVTHAQAIENCDDDPKWAKITDHYRVIYFSAAPVFLARADALIHASKLYDEIMESDFPVLEYGIQFLEFDRPLLDESRDEAEEFIDAFWMQR